MSCVHFRASVRISNASRSGSSQCIQMHPVQSGANAPDECTPPESMSGRAECTRSGGVSVAHFVRIQQVVNTRTQKRA